MEPGGGGLDCSIAMRSYEVYSHSYEMYSHSYEMYSDSYEMYSASYEMYRVVHTSPQAIVAKLSACQMEYLSENCHAPDSRLIIHVQARKPLS